MHLLSVTSESVFYYIWTILCFFWTKLASGSVLKIKCLIKDSIFFSCFQCLFANCCMLFNQSERVSELDSFQRDYKVCLLSLRWGCWPILWSNYGAEFQKWENAASSHFLALLEKMWLIKLTLDQSHWQNVSSGLTQFSTQLVHSHVIHKRETPINKQSHTSACLWIQQNNHAVKQLTIWCIFKATE